MSKSVVQSGAQVKTAPRASRQAFRRPWGSIAMFIGPALFLYFLLIIVPVGMTFFNSVHILRMDLGMKREWVGLQHYIKLLAEDEIFRMAVKNSFIWAIFASVVDIPFALLLALILYTKLPLTRLFRISWFTPMLVSWVVVGFIFRWVYNYDWGVVNTVLRGVGLEAWVRNWLGDPKTALLSLMVITMWKFLGFNMVIFLAALSSIPDDLVDAARIDGCNRGQLVFHVVIPLIRSTAVNLLILAFIGKMKQFALVWVSTMGGPMHYTETVATYVQNRAFNWRTLDLGYPSAIAVIWFIVILAVTVLFTRTLQRREVLEF
jgi:ABC-type sugar transport system permease subunit